MKKNIKTIIKKISVGVCATPLLIGSIFGIYNLTKNDSASLPPLGTGIDWSLYELDIPTIYVPTPDVPIVTVPTVTIPTVDTPEINVVKINLDQYEELLDSSTDLILSDIESVLDTINLNEATTDIQSNDIDIPIIEISIDDIGLDDLTTVELTEVYVPDYDVPNVPADDFNEWVNFAQYAKSKFVDYRMFLNDSTINIKNENIVEWLKLYEEFKDSQPITYIEIKEKFKMITEVCIPKTTQSLDILDQNLTYYKSEGYDSVLVTFTTHDTTENVLNTVKYIIKNHQMKVWLAYSGDETLKTSVFGDPAEFKQILLQTAPYLSGYINSWRRTSSHLWAQDSEFMNFVNHTLRSTNPKLPIIGELYYGNTYKYDKHKTVGFGTNIFKNTSGIMFVNFGFLNVNVPYLMNMTIKKRIGNIPAIACVLGTNAYYLTEQKNNLSYEENMKIKHIIENKFMLNGCIGTVTLSDDGRYLKTNDLTQTLYHTLNGK